MAKANQYTLVKLGEKQYSLIGKNFSLYDLTGVFYYDDRIHADVNDSLIFATGCSIKAEISNFVGFEDSDNVSQSEYFNEDKYLRVGYFGETSSRVGFKCR
jgi:hypothetical protein